MTHFSVSTHHTFLRRVLNCSLIAMCKVSKQFFSLDPQENEKKDVVSATECTAPNLSMALSSGLAILFYFSLSKPLHSMRMVLAIRLFEFRRRKDIGSMYAKLLRCTVYACEASLAIDQEYIRTSYALLQEYIRTRVCNTTHWDLAQRNFK